MLNKENRLEIILFVASISIICGISVFNNESIIAILYAVCGIIYTLFAGKGKVLCYLFGIIATCCYAYLTFKSGVYGNCLLNLCYYLPMQIVGIFEWKKHLKPNNVIEKIRLGKELGLVVYAITFGVSLLFVWWLNILNDSMPFLDGITTVMSILGMYLTVKRCIEQWIVWIIVDFLVIIMWLKLSFTISNTYSTIVIWTVYLVLGIYFYIKWRKEMD